MTTATAGTAEYAREYARRRYRGLPTKGLAEEMRSGRYVPTETGREGHQPLTEVRRRDAEVMICNRAPTSKVMDALGLSYEQVQSVRERMGS